MHLVGKIKLNALVTLQNLVVQAHLNLCTPGSNNESIFYALVFGRKIMLSFDITLCITCIFMISIWRIQQTWYWQTFTVWNLVCETCHMADDKSGYLAVLSDLAVMPKVTYLLSRNNNPLKGTSGSLNIIGTATQDVTRQFSHCQKPYTCKAAHLRYPHLVRIP